MSFLPGMATSRPQRRATLRLSTIIDVITSFSDMTSAGLRCSRVLRTMLGTRLGGAAVWTFPFKGLGLVPGPSVSTESLSWCASDSFPDRPFLGGNLARSQNKEHGLVCPDSKWC
jgi:hypothetical protein